jgi:hypothetical protein
VTATWITHISESKWRRVRRELEDNGLTLPFTAGVAQNRKTGYTVSNRYDRDISQLEIKITYPGDYHPLSIGTCLDHLFDSSGIVTP